MDNELTIPMVEAGSGLGGFGGYSASIADQGPQGQLPSLQNFADDEVVQQRVQDEIVPVITFTRSTRMGLEEEWRAIRRCEYLLHDEGRKYFGRSDAYLPVFNRNSQLLTSRLARGLFPSDDYMDVSVRGGGDPSSAKPLKTYLQWEFEENARLRDAMKPFLRQFVNYGNAVLKVWYRQDIRSEGTLHREPDIAALIRGQPSFEQNKNYGLAVQARSIFSTYFHPVTASSLDEITLIFEDIVVPRGYAREMVAKGKWSRKVAGGEVPSAPPIPNLSTDMADQITNMTAITAPSPGILGGKDIGEMLPITEVWTYLRLPKAALLPWEHEDDPVPVRIVLAGSAALEITRNPFYHQKPPYVVGRANVQPGLFYGYAFGRVSRSLQYLANDFANQTNDVGVLSLNPVTIMNPGVIAGPIRPFAPGVTWYLTDPEHGVQFRHPDWELMQAGMEMLKSTTGMLQDFGGAPPIMQGAAAGGVAKTATGGQMLNANAQQPLQDIVEDLENQVMIPLMRIATKLGQQYCSPDTMARVAGEPVMIINPADLSIDAAFRWLASSQIGNAQQRAQVLMQLMQSILPLQPALMPLGYQLNPVAVLKKIWADMGYRGFDEFVIKVPPQPGLAPPGPGQALPSGLGGNRVRSPLEQIMGQFGLSPNGEGEDNSAFMGVRGEADQLAGGLGAMH